MGNLASLKLDVQSKDSPIYRGLYRQIRDQILEGHLAPGARLPSSRNLAAELNCSRGTVERAYELLLAEGFIQGAGAAGTRVNSNLDKNLIASGVLRSGQRTTQRSEAQRPDWTPRPLQAGVPAFDAFPHKLWNKLINKHAKSTGINQFACSYPFGYPPLRQAITNYLAISRGINTEPEQVFITAGFQGALSTIVQCLAGVEDQIWCEDPGYFRARNGLEQLGVSVIPVPVDGEGLQVNEGLKMAPNAKFALITPTHQSPLGVTLSLSRRMELLHWAKAQGSWILEDDYDSEFRYGEKPLPALKSLDANCRVIYTGSFSKVLSPSLKLGYVVVPRQLQSVIENSFSSLWSVGSVLEQKVITELMTGGHFSLHIKKMRKLYGERRTALADALRNRLSGKIEVSLQASGMHLIGKLLTVRNDELLLRKLHELGLRPSLLSEFQIQAEHPPALLLGFTNVDVASAENIVEKLAQAIEEMQ